MRAQNTKMQSLKLLLAISVFVCGVRTQDNFYFSVQPKSASVLNGQSVTLECSVSDNRNIAIHWTLDSNTLTPTTRRFQNGTHLHITRADPELDRGEFRCIAINSTTGFSLSSLAASLNVLWIGDSVKVMLHSPESALQVRDGVELQLRCRADGNPEVEVEWYRNSVRVFRNDRTALRGRRLTVTNISAWDNGVYSCRAVNEAGHVDSIENFVLALSHPLAAKVLKLPSDVTIRRTDPARFDCAFENAAIIEWYARDEGPLTNTTRMTVFSNGSLRIHPVKKADEGLFKCVGIRGVGKDGEEPVQTFVAELRIAELDPITEDSFEPRAVTPNHVVPENQLFEVTCKRPRGFPTPRVWWESPDGRVISDSGRIRVDDTRLIIDSAKKPDSGNYTCIAENMAGNKKGVIQIHVTSAPMVTSDPKSILVDEGEPALLSCAYSGSPYPLTTVSWLKDDRPVQTSDPHYNIFLHNSTIYIKTVQMQDAGKYVCEVNTTGFKPVRSQNATLYIKERLKFLPPPVDRKMELSLSSRIYCKARGDTKPVIKWIKEGQRFFDWPAHVKDENGTLTFEKVVKEDAGTYTCIATNSQGIINATIKVDVIVAPKFVVRPSNTTAFEGYPILLHCQAAGDPKPTIQWDKNNEFNGYNQHRFTMLENGSLYAREVHMNDEGKYGCTAGNSGGLKREEIILVVKSAEDYVPFMTNSGGAGGDGNSSGEKEESVMTKTVMITLGGASAYIVLVVGLMVWCRYRRAKRKAAYLQQSTAAEGNLLNKTENGDVAHEAEMKEKETHEYRDSVKSDGEAQSHSSGQSHHSKRSRSSYDKLVFPRSDLQTIMLLGRGEFGDVLLAKAHGIRDTEADTLVMVKALISHDEGVHFDFKREMDMYHKLNHPNIARLLGVCKEAEPQFMLMEYSDWGDLKQYLLATRADNPRKSPRPAQPSVANVISMASQVALGMEYMSNQRMTHRDLAARNCLVASNLDIKISSPSLCKDTYAHEYCRLHGRLLPVRWMPLESILEDEFSTKSDVYSFAVLVWEIFMQADLPFLDQTDDAYLKARKTKELVLSVPEKCPTQLKDLMSKSWADSPKERPSFSEIVVRIGEISVDTDC